MPNLKAGETGKGKQLTASNDYDNKDKKENSNKKGAAGQGYKAVPYEEFREKFEVISKTCKKQFKEVVKRICVLHNDSGKYIALKEPKNFCSDYSRVPKTSIRVVTRIIKEIIRSTNTCLEDMSGASTVNLTPFSVLLYSFNFMVVRRYPVLLPFLMKFNISRLIKSLRKTDWISSRIKDSKKINFFQFFVRVFVFLDPKYISSSLEDFVDQSTILIKGEKYIYPIE